MHQNTKKKFADTKITPIFAAETPNKRLTTKTSKAMENHNDISLSEVREMIIRYGAKYMERYESDLYYDCNSVGQMQPGDTIFWMVSGTHTHMYTAKELHDQNIDINLVRGNRFNYRIDCKARSRYGNGVQFDMTQVSDMEIQTAVNDYQKKLADAEI